MSKKILIIDDDFISQNMQISTLTRAGYTVIVTSNGEDGINRAVEKLPDLIILDIMMPGMDGMDVASLLKANPKTERIPIIFLSGLITERGKKNKGENDAISYLPKPYNGDELLSEVRKYFLEVK